MKRGLDLSRRHFLVTSAAAGGLSLGFHIPFAAAETAALTQPEINAWVAIKSDDTVVIRISRAEMGQGTMTGLAQLVAEELDCDWSKVTTESPTPGENLLRHRVWGNFSTTGSRGIRESQDYVRKGGAAARMMLISAAAQAWNVPAAECSAKASVITHAASGRTTSYGKVATAAAKIEPPTDVPLKDPKTWTIAGQPLKRLDTAGKLNGSQVYGIDFKLPGMLNAAIRQCPVFGGKVKKFDAASIASMPGVKHVLTIDDNAVVVVADKWWQAKTALDALAIEWDGGESAHVSSATIAAKLAEGLAADKGFIGNKTGNFDAAKAAAAKTIEAVYAYPYQNHATLEPMNATARWTPEKCEVWCPTQGSETSLAVAAEAAELAVAKCDVIKINPGGGFGRRGAGNDFTRQAVLVAKQIPGVPIKLVWTRQEDMQHGLYHPITQAKLTATLDASGKVTGFRMRISGQSIVAARIPELLQNGRDPLVFQGLNPGGPEGAFGYDIPNVLIDHAMHNPHVPPGFWRGVNSNHNAIYVESFIDELAHAAGEDPLAFRRKMMANHPKHLAVLEAAAAKAGWGTTAPPGIYRGLAHFMGFGSYTAAVAEVSVTSGVVKIHRIFAATDPGTIVNPQQVETQVAGSFSYGLSAMLFGECSVKDGAIVQDNFDTYPVVRMKDMPQVETVLVPSGGFWGGVGEPTIAVAAPAVLNAIFAATGKRIRHFPLRNQDLGKA